MPNLLILFRSNHLCESRSLAGEMSDRTERGVSLRQDELYHHRAPFPVRSLKGQGSPGRMVLPAGC